MDFIVVVLHLECHAYKQDEALRFQSVSFLPLPVYRTYNDNHPFFRPFLPRHLRFASSLHLSTFTTASIPLSLLGVWFSLEMIVVLLVKLICFVAVCLVKGCVFSNAKLKQWAHTRWSQMSDNPCAFLSGGELRTSNDLKAKVKVFLFQKDEEEVLSDWLQYYSYMFGAENLVVIDHESQSQDVCRLLELYRLCGAEVITFSGSFERKHAVLTKEMLKHKNTFLLPLDADEFIVADNTISANSSLPSLHVHRAKLNQAFRKLPIDGRKYKFAYTYSARPNTTVCHDFVSNSKANATTDRSNRRTVTSQLALERQPYFTRSKTFYYSDGFLYTDQGNHYGAVKHDQNVLNDHPAIGKNLSHYFAPLEASLLHYTMSSYNARKNKYVRGFAAYNFTLETDCSKEKNGLGYCWEAKYFLNSTDNGRNFYLQSCLSNQTGTSLASVSEWFQHRAQSMSTILGVQKRS